MPENQEKKNRFIKIPLEKKEKIRIKPRWGTPHGKIGKKDFENKLMKATTIGSIRFEELNKTYFLIDLFDNYGSQNVKNTLNKLNLKIESIFEPEKIFVSGDTNKLKELDIDILPNYVFDTIKNINIIESNERISSNLRQLLSDSSENKLFKIHIKLFDIDEFVKDKFFNHIKSILIKDNSINDFIFKSNTGIISCSCTKLSIEKISKLPIVKNIYVPPKAIKTTQSYQETPIYSRNELRLEKNTNNNIPILCIIDSGISENFNDFISIKDNGRFSDNDDKQDHGTKVASLALFGIDLLNYETNLKNNLQIISYKIEDDSDPEFDIDLVNEIINAIDKFLDKTKVFSISYAYSSIDIEAQIDLLNSLDKKIQEKNVVVCISAGNILLPDVRMNYHRYPRYLKEFPVLCPSDGKNVISVGSICLRTKHHNRLYLSTHSRLGLTFSLISRIEKRSEFFKPNIHTYGGSNLTNNNIDPDHQIPVINNQGDMVYEEGTSFATPLISSLFANLYKIYEDDYQNSELFKAILLNRCKYDELYNIPIFYLDDLSNLFFCNNDIVFNIEGELEPLIRMEDNNSGKKEVISRGYSVKFYLPNEAESLDIISVHSSNYKNNSILYHNTRLIVKIIKSNGALLKKDYGTPNRFIPITFAHYKFKRNFVGITECEITSEVRGISKEDLRNVLIRFGVSLRVNIKNKCKLKFQEIYDNAKKELNVEPKIIIKPQQIYNLLDA